MSNPLKTPSEWQRAVEGTGLASLLVLIEARMSRTLKAWMAPEDILQEVLLQVWRDRERIEWHGPRAFRAWLLTIIDNRIRDAAAFQAAQKRGGGIRSRPIDTADDRSGAHPFFEPVASTTPSRLALYAEEAAAISEAFDALPADLRDVVWMRLLEQRPITEIAACLEIGESAVRHRFRKGAAIYRTHLRSALSSRSALRNANSGTHSRLDAAS